MDSGKVAIAHQVTTLNWVSRVRHDLHRSCSRQLRHPGHSIAAKTLREGKKEVRQFVPASQASIDKPAVGPVREPLFTRPEVKIPSHLRSRWNYPVNQHVRAEVLVMMPIKVRRRSVVEANELLNLRLIDVTKLISERRVVNQERVFVRCQETGHALVAIRQ